MPSWTSEARRLAELTSHATTVPAITSHLGRGAIVVALGNRRFVEAFRNLRVELQENAVIAAAVLADGRAAMILAGPEDEDDGVAYDFTEAALRAQGINTLAMADADPAYYVKLGDADFQAEAFAKLAAA
jgi:hypothetical protein